MSRQPGVMNGTAYVLPKMGRKGLGWVKKLEKLLLRTLHEDLDSLSLQSCIGLWFSSLPLGIESKW